MKKLLAICFILLLLNAKSYSQTKQFPFYGFELSNYEVGDTLEYIYNSMGMDPSSNNFSAGSTTVSVIVKKELSGSDSIRYTVHEVNNGFYTIYGINAHSSTYANDDTAKSTVTNDTVYNNNNNFIKVQLFKLDFSSPNLDTSCSGCRPDSAYVKFDTSNGLKRLRLDFHSQWISSGYEAIENIGITEASSITEYDGDVDWSLSLAYAHLAHYGVYGAYSKLIDNASQPSVLKNNISIRYNNGNAYLFLASSQNLPSPALTIYDLLGRPLETTQVNTGSNLINLNNFAKGMYLYKVTSNGNVLGQGKLMNL